MLPTAVPTPGPSELRPKKATDGVRIRAVRFDVFGGADVGGCKPRSKLRAILARLLGA